MADSQHAAFPPTRSTLVQLAADPDSPGWKAGWERFFRGYWAPLYAYLRRTGSDAQDAQDLLQDFFVRGLEGRVLASYDPARGRLRSFLLTCVTNHRRQAQRKERARPDRLPWLNAEGLPPLEASAASPLEAFDREWNLCLVEQALAAVREQLARKRDEVGAALLERWVLAREREDADAVAASLGLTRGALYTRATRLRNALSQETERRLRFLSGDPERLAAERDAVLRMFRERA
ncbi:MAG: sigma-70 family RNA polymerase sigma factor [Planctomycetes bacterium]|nr:sigma-70 family RNA polymerase sigma factor [Planctomycetota bacterium]